MKNFTLLMIITLAIFTGLSAQQVQNAGFENWEDAGTVIDEPINWSSIKTSDGGDLINSAAPVVWGQSTDAHTGNYSVQLTNVLTIGSIIATGIVTNGRIHAEFNPDASNAHTVPDEEKWHTVLTGKPDSVSIWAKYLPQGSDTGRVQVLLHKDYAQLPSTPETQANWIAYAQIDISGTVSGWTRFSAPFTYFSTENPEYMLIVLTSGAGTTPVEGSVINYDDMELIYGPNSIGENEKEKNLISIDGNRLLLYDFQASAIKGSTLTILNASGMAIYRASIRSDEILLNEHFFNTGIYLVIINGQNINYSQKIFIR